MPNGFRWWDEWFAGNEFFADMSAIFTDYYRTGGTDWYVTDVRNLQNPISTGGLNWYPEKSHFGTTDAVAYANSTIYSYAMYLLLQGGYHHRAGQTSIIGGVTIPHILVTAQPSSAVKAVLLGAISDLRFNDQKFTAPNLKAMMVARAYNMYGSAMAQEVSNAWTAVGVGYNCSGPPAIPQFQTWPAYCRAQNTFTWAAEPGVKYHGVIKATYQSWDFGAITTTDGPVSSCEVNPNQAAVFRMRACNGCGCSEWSYEEYLPFWSPCQ